MPSSLQSSTSTTCTANIKHAITSETMWDYGCSTVVAEMAIYSMLLVQLHWITTVTYDFTGVLNILDGSLPKWRLQFQSYDSIIALNYSLQLGCKLEKVFTINRKNADFRF